MAKTIVMNELIVDYLHIDYENQRVIAGYRMVDASGTTWESGEGFFYVTMPEEPPGGYPPNWFTLPAGYIPTLLSLQSDADDALTAALLV